MANSEASRSIENLVVYDWPTPYARPAGMCGHSDAFRFLWDLPGFKFMELGTYDCNSSECQMPDNCKVNDWYVSTTEQRQCETDL